MNTTVGTCSICGGAVTIPTIWHATIPPVPTCTKCGATAKRHGPTIEMERPRPAVTTDVADLLKKVRDR